MRGGLKSDTEENALQERRKSELLLREQGMGKEENASPSVVKGDMVGVAGARMGTGQRAGSRLMPETRWSWVGCPRDQHRTRLS